MNRIAALLAHEFRQVLPAMLFFFVLFHLIALRAMVHEIHWPLFLVLTLWIVGGLLLYCLAVEFYRALGAEWVKGLLFGDDEEAR